MARPIGPYHIIKVEMYRFLNSKIIITTFKGRSYLVINISSVNRKLIKLKLIHIHVNSHKCKNNQTPKYSRHIF